MPDELASGNCKAEYPSKYTLKHPIGCSFFPGHGPVVVVEVYSDSDGEGTEVEVWKHGNEHELTWWNDPAPKY